jgi:hypothetical protein
MSEIELIADALQLLSLSRSERSNALQGIADVDEEALQSFYDVAPLLEREDVVAALPSRAIAALFGIVAALDRIEPRSARSEVVARHDEARGLAREALLAIQPQAA